MLLEYEWGNPAAAAAAMLLFGEDSGQDTNVDRHQVFDHNYGHGLGMDFFQQPQPLSAAALFSTPSASSTSCHQRYGLALPPPPARIGLNLGVRTYFSSTSPEEMMVGRVCRRRTRTARCQAEGCGADLTHAKHYHRRHKVCEFHSKASIVIAAGLSQRFCQQCSRFHVLSEFDQGKRSCRKRLADHNRRRRKSQDLSTSSAIVNSLNNNNNTTNSNHSNSPNPEKALITTSSGNNNNGTTTTSSSVTRVSSPPPLQAPMALPATPMALGLGCGSVVAVPAAAGMSASSSTGTSEVSFLSHLGDFRGHEHRFPSWDEPEDGSSIRGIYQNKQ